MPCLVTGNASEGLPAGLQRGVESREALRDRGSSLGVRGAESDQALRGMQASPLPLWTWPPTVTASEVGHFFTPGLFLSPLVTSPLLQGWSSGTREQNSTFRSLSLRSTIGSGCSKNPWVTGSCWNCRVEHGTGGSLAFTVTPSCRE